MSDHNAPERLAWSGLNLQQPVHERFEQVVSALPEKLAVQTLHRAITYAELNRLANRIARKLLQTDAVPVRDTPIGILMPQGIHLIAAALGVMKAGGFYVPLDPSTPAARTEHMLVDAGALLFVIDSTVAPESRAMLAATATLIDIDALEEGLDDGNLAVETNSGNLAYLLYTSGSTGAPKGVMQSHRHMMHNAWVHSKSFEIEPHDRQSLLYPCNVYGSVRDTFNALLNGASLHVLSVKNEELALLPDWLRNERISIYCSVATVFRQLGRWLDDESHFPDLRIIKLGGEVVYAQDVALYKKHFSDQCRLSCGLASTETGAVAQYFIDKSTVVSQNTALMGVPVDDTEILLLDDEGLPVQDGQVGEIAIRSRYLSSGYWRHDALTAERFRNLPGEDGLCVFRMGDLGEKLAGGAFVHRGRKDLQVKIRGNRIEIPDVEQAILRTGAVREIAVIATQDGAGQLVLIAYVEWVDAGTNNASELRQLLREKIPASMIPSHIVALEKIPLLPNGKKDRNALPEFKFPIAGALSDSGLPSDAVARICSSVLGIQQLSRTTNFFELGADSLKLVSIYRALVKELKVDLMLVDIFQHPTVEALSEYVRPKMLAGIAVQTSSMMPIPSVPSPLGARDASGKSHVAIIGMAGRFPGAADVSAFWKNIVDGVEMLTPIDMEDLKRQGTATAELDDPNYVPVTSFLDDIEKFDNEFFRMTRREAELLDPQIRLLLECGVEAFEDAGELPSGNPDTGVFVSVGKSNYYLNNVRTRDDILAQVGDRRALLFNDRTYAATLLSYKLDLRGPSLHIDTACSSSLVAVHHAVRSLQAGDCRLALAGGARVIVPHGRGYLCGDGGIESSSGQCRPFDRDASGTVFGNGAGVVLLKRLEDAVREGNHIYGVIRGSAVSNDGGAKVGFTAPVASGQAFTIQRALHDAKVEPSDIQYVETHGTATVVGDPIEIAALNQAFSGYPDGGRCPIGSIKGNVGHMSTASGVVGLMKVALAIKHKTLPPSIHYEAPNPHIPFQEGPFYVNTTSLPWGRNDGSRIAGVSSFGLGGTNAHIVVEQPPEAAARGARADAETAELLVVSGQTSGALAAHVARIAAFLRSEPQVPLKHMASTLARGRTHHACRASFVGGTASTLLGQMDGFPASMRSHSPAEARPKVAFLFPGQGTQYVGMMRDLYSDIPDFAGYVDTCCAILKPLLQEDLRAIVFPPSGSEAAAEELLRQTRISQPALFVFEYALARMWIQWGVEPVACLGHSLGEYVAACLSGVFSLRSALGLVVERGRWMQSAPPRRDACGLVHRGGTVRPPCRDRVLARGHQLNQADGRFRHFRPGGALQGGAGQKATSSYAAPYVARLSLAHHGRHPGGVQGVLRRA